MDDNEFPDEFNLRFRIHALYVHLRATLDFADEISREGPDHLTPDDMKLYDDLTNQLERGWMEMMKMKKRVRGLV